jgi:hypothetical protein
MPVNIYGGGATTNQNGLAFEQETSLRTAFENQGYNVVNNEVFLNMNVKGMITSKHGLYRDILIPNNIIWSEILSKQLLPDEVFYNYSNRTIYIIEKKFQSAAGSVDEKLQTCDFKKRQYQKLLRDMIVTVEYIYVINEWFDHPSYNDVKEYISLVGCRYYTRILPLEALGLL